jgi:hypothetical protein
LVSKWIRQGFPRARAGKGRQRPGDGFPGAALRRESGSANPFRQGFRGSSLPPVR